MLTGQADEKVIERAKREANLYTCLHKPWTEEELYQALASVWE
jgi:hypothetical protein